MNKMLRRITGVIIAVAGMVCLVRGGAADQIDDGDLEYLIKKSDFVGVGRIIDEPHEKEISSYIDWYEARFRCKILSTMKGAISEKVIDIIFGYGNRMSTNLFKGSNIMLFLGEKENSGCYRLISKSVLSANDHSAGQTQAIISQGCLPTPR